MKKGSLKIFLIIAITSFLAAGCIPVRAWQRMYLNDPDMELSKRKIENYELSAESYREGAAGGNGGKTGGGCGCN